MVKGIKKPRNIINIVIAFAFIFVLNVVPNYFVGASETVGATPYQPVPLSLGQTTGQLEPGGEVWYSISLTNFLPDPESLDLTLIFTPNNGHRQHKVRFDVYSTSVLKQWLRGDIEEFTNMGAGELVSRDRNPITGEYIWKGWLVDNETYLIRLRNDNGITVDYHLFTRDIVDVELGEKPAPAKPIKVDPGTDPYHPIPIDPSETDVRGQIAPGERIWYSFYKTDFFHDRERVDFTLIATPDDGHRRHRLHMEIFEARQLHKWARGDLNQLDNMGAGNIVSRDGNPYTMEFVWNGYVDDNATHFIRMTNTSDIPLDYVLFNKDVINVELGDPTNKPKPAEYVPPGTDPFHPETITSGLLRGELGAGQEYWYAISRTDFQPDAEPLDLTLIFTPDDGHRQHKVHMDIFAQNQLHKWARGDTELLINVGAGSIVTRDRNYKTAEKVWNGWIPDNDTYLIRLRNNNADTINYWLFTSDVYNVDLGAMDQ
ncbi:MAG: hypothetical protein AAF629_26290 [Chloroflexota bacterium]